LLWERSAGSFGESTEFPEESDMVDAREEDVEGFTQVDNTFFDEDGRGVYRSEGYGFEIHFPPQYQLNAAPDQRALNAGLELPDQTPIWEFNLKDPLFYQGTNLVNASLILQVTRGEEALLLCTVHKNGSQLQIDSKPLDEVQINEVVFLKDVVVEGVMGGMINRISYRMISQGACYELTEIIQTNNPEGYPAETIKIVDQDLVFSEMDRVLETFSLLEGEPSFPEIKYPVRESSGQYLEKAIGDYADGIDVSHWQGNIGWSQVYNAGYRFAYIKGTEGVGWTDSKFHENMSAGNAAGMYLGVYHFARPDLGNTGKEEAEYFLSKVGDYLESGNLRPVLDLEFRGTLDKEALSAWALEWLQTVENQTGVAPLIYTNLYFINTFLNSTVTDYELWIAYWNCDPTVTGQIPPTGKWGDWAFWQYCVEDEGYVPGISSRIDMDIYNGSDERLVDYDAASPIWVNLQSDERTAPRPVSVDLTANVYGDLGGPVFYAFWWDCPALSADQEAVEADCGELPNPVPKECLSNDVGLVCSQFKEDTYKISHTYYDVGDYSAKVIVSRRGGDPTEDRYQVSVTNPIESIEVDPASPVSAPIAFDLDLLVNVEFNSGADGALQVEIMEKGSDTIIISDCQLVVDGEYGIKSFILYMSEDQPAVINYDVKTRYRPQGSCPVVDGNINDVAVDLVIDYGYAQFNRVGFFALDQREWYLKNTLSPGWQDVTIVRFGGADSSWFPVSGDWDGNGFDTPGIYDPVQKKWYLKNDLDSGWDNVIVIKFGTADSHWIPVTGDWNGDGVDTVGFYAPESGKWLLKTSQSDGWGDITTVKYQGESSWLALAGDWDGDGYDTPGFFESDSSKWYLKNDLMNGWSNYISLRFGDGGANWNAVSGDWDGDGIDDLGFLDADQGKWHLKAGQDNGWVNVYSFRFGGGLVGPVPIIGNW